MPGARHDLVVHYTFRSSMSIWSILVAKLKPYIFAPRLFRARGKIPANIVASIYLRSVKSCLVFAVAVLDHYLKKAQEQDLKAVCLDISSLHKLIV
jgi:hypothetical protein